MSRESILARVLALAQAVKTDDVTIKSAVRNRGLLDTEKRPAIVLLDGDETNNLPPRPPGRGGTTLPPAIVTMTPELFILLEEVRPKQEDKQVGQRINAYREALASALAGGTVLLGLLGSNGRTEDRGCAADLKSGAALSGEMRLDFAFTYALSPASASAS